MNLIKRFEKVLKQPAEVFSNVSNESFGSAFLYYVVWFAAAMFVSAAFSALFGKGSAFLVLVYPVAAVFIAVFSLPFAAIGVGLLHLSAKIVGGKGKFIDLWKANMYAATPTFIQIALGALPVLGFLVSAVSGIWALVLSVIALSKVEKLSTGKAILAIFLSAIIAVVVIGILLVAAGAMIYGMLSSMGVLAAMSNATV